MVEALLVIRPAVDLNTVFRAANQALGRTLTKAIDRSAVPLSDDAKFISALSAFSLYEPTNAVDHIRQSNHELFFLHYTFLCYADADTGFKLREWTKLDTTSHFALDGGVVFFASGSLAEWKRASIECCSAKATFNLRLLFDKIILQLEAQGVADIWFEQRKKMLKDQTFLLEDKR